MSGEIDGKTESGTPEANFTLSNNFAVVMGDERFYRLFGEKTLYTSKGSSGFRIVYGIGRCCSLCGCTVYDRK